MPPLDRPSAPCDRRASVATGKTELVARAPSAFERAATERGSPFRPRACLSAPAHRDLQRIAPGGSLSRARSNAARIAFNVLAFRRGYRTSYIRWPRQPQRGGARKVGPEAEPGARDVPRGRARAPRPPHMPLHYQNHLLRRVRLKKRHMPVRVVDRSIFPPVDDSHGPPYDIPLPIRHCLTYARLPLGCSAVERL